VAAALFQPYWIGAPGGFAATVVERRRPIVRWMPDDNLYIVGASLAMIGGLASLSV
jgi:hypothetical protein